MSAEPAPDPGHKARGPRNKQLKKRVSSAFPPRERREKLLWHQLESFKNRSGAAGYELQLPPEDSFLRRCAHEYSDRLGLDHR